MSATDRAVVSVWCVSLRCAASAERALLALLDADEAARAARFATRELRRRYVVSHGVLRLILAAYTGGDPRAIRFGTGARGKPYLAGRAPHFSLSHGDDVALVAVSWGGPVGVDVERIRPDVGLAAFARSLMAAPDVASIEALPPNRRERAWFQAWTRLEAVAKAGASPCHVWDLDIDQAHVGALAV